MKKRQIAITGFGLTKGKELEEVTQVANPAADLLKQIEIQEAECLNQILTRFCLLNGLKIDILKCETREFPDRPNYWEYYYRGNAPKLPGIMVHFLMGRELLIENNQPVLNVTFNKDLM